MLHLETTQSFHSIYILQSMEEMAIIYMQGLYSLTVYQIMVSALSFGL